MKMTIKNELEKAIELIGDKITWEHTRDGNERVPIYEKEFEKRGIAKENLISIFGQLRTKEFLVSNKIEYGADHPQVLPGGVKFLFRLERNKIHKYKAYMLVVNRKKFARLALHNPKIYYNYASGIGFINSKEFKFRVHTPECKVFELLYRKINQRVSKDEIIRASGLPIPRTESGKMYTINDIAKKIRAKTKLDNRNVVLNDGNLTLIGKKVSSPPV